MKYLITILFVSGLWGAQGTTTTFYEALKSSSLTTIEDALEQIEEQPTTTTNKAYRGTLLMKKSDFIKKVSQKIKVFKEGHALLEAAIKKYPKKVEYRFLRLAIQEHAPKVLKYNKNIEEDKELIIAGYHDLSSSLRTYIKTYCKQSTVLSVSEL